MSQRSLQLKATGACTLEELEDTRLARRDVERLLYVFTSKAR